MRNFNVFALHPATLAGQGRVLARLPGGVRFIVLAVAGAGIIAVFAQLAVPLWPVPVTGQSLTVLTIGMAYGARLGTVTLVIYVLAGAAGLPVFAKMASEIGRAHV